MAETIDSLEIKISSDAKNASGGIDKLAESLLKLKNRMAGFQKINFNGLSGGLKQLVGATKGLEVEKLTNYSIALKNLSDSVRIFSGIGKQVEPAIRNLEKLARVDLSKLQISGDFSGMKKLADGIRELLAVIPGLATLKTTDLNRSLVSLEKLGTINFGSLVQNAQSLSGIDFSTFTKIAQGIDALSASMQRLSVLKTADINRSIQVLQQLGTVNIGNLAQSLQSLSGIDFSTLSNLGTAFQGFATALSSSDKVPGAIAKIFNSLSTLAASAGNIPLVTMNLPVLSTEIQRFISIMAATPVVDAGTVSLVAALSGLSGAGEKIQKVTAALPSLTNGVESFIKTLSAMPPLDNNILRTVEALAKLANAGGKAGSASRSLQNDINSLSGSINKLSGNTIKTANGIKSFTTQILSAMGITTGIYGLVRAIKASVSTFSNLIEVENVVNKTFGDMKQKVEDLASTSIQDFGMSELTTKQISSRFQAMGVAMGFTQDKMSDMSIELTKLAADMASFYNVDQNKVAQSLESIFTGTTRPLRTWGLDLTQATLQAWALKQGIDVNVKSMSQMEKTMLRYQYVIAQTREISNDFRDTQGSFANQTRILGQQFQQLGSIIGGGLVTAFLPVIKVLNLVIAKIIQFANTLASFFGKLFGIKKVTASVGAGFAGIADSAENMTDGTETATGGISNVGKSAGKAGKQLNKFVAAWHEVNSMSSDSNDNAGGGGGGGIDMPDMTFPSNYNLDLTATDDVSPVIEKIRQKFIELSNLFIKGFKIGLGDISVFDSIQQNLLNIKNSFLNIFTDNKVLESFNNLLDTLAYNYGIQVGSFTSIGTSIIDNITGGAALYLDSAKERIKEYLISMFDITSESNTIVTNFTAAIADIFTVFRSDDAKAITSDIIQIFSDGFMGISELAAKIGRDILGLLLNPITENKSKFKEAIENALSPIEEVLGTLAESFTHMWETINQTYDDHIKPMFDSITSGLSEIVGSLLDGYNEYIVPVLDRLSEKFTDVWQNTITPLLDNFIGLFGDVGDLVTSVWNNVLQPIINWIAQHIMPAVAPVLEALGNAFLDAFEVIGKILDGFITSAKGLVKFLTNAFNRDWKQAWQNLKQVFQGIWSIVPSFIREPIETAANGLSNFLTNIFHGNWTGAWQDITDGFNSIWELVPGFIKEPIIEAGEGVLSFLSDIFSGNWTGAWETIQNNFNNIWGLMPNSIKEPIETTVNGLIEFLMGTFLGNWELAWQGIQDTFQGIWDGLPDIVKTPIRSIIGFINTMISAVESGINGVISGLNTISLNIPATPFTDAFTLGFHLSKISLPKIPLLAKGGVIDKATLALIGESGKEAIVPLERNTQWIDSVSERIAKNFGNYKLDLSIPKVDFTPSTSSDLGSFQSTMQMEMDAKMAEIAFENQQLRASMEENNRILEKILAQGIVLDDNKFTSMYKRSATSYRKRTGGQLGTSF